MTHSAPTAPASVASTGRFTVALVGNPNTGKTTLFNALSGLRQRVGNYPGVTVETKKGQMTVGGRTIDLVDLPGTYSLAPRSPDEMVAVNLILGRQAGEPRPDVVLSIVDASNLERNLYLTSQVIELGVPVVVALNMTDIAGRHGLRIDVDRLSRQLGVPVVPIQANKSKGLDELKQALACGAGGSPAADPGRRGACPTFPAPLEREVQELQDTLGPGVPPYLVRRLLLDVEGWTERQLEAGHPELAARVEQARKRLAESGCAVPAVEARARYTWVREVTAGCIERPKERPVTATDRLDRVLTHRVWGTLVFLAVMAGMFQAIFTWARPLMKLIGDGKDAVALMLTESMPPGPFTSLLVGGVLEGVGSVVVFLPQILILFVFIAILEDCGYMARAAFLMDRIMARCGLSGKSFIPLLSSVACAVPGIMAARVIEDRRDRLATILVAPLMSCSARLPVYILLIGAFLTTGYPFWLPGLVMFALYGVGLVVAPLVALLLKRTLLRGETPVFVMEMPAYKWPSGRQVLRRMFDSGWAFVRRAGTLILATMVLVWTLLYFPTGHPQGSTYPERIAREEATIREPRARLKELEEEADKARDELKALPAPSPERNEIQARLADLEARQKPVEDEVGPVEERINALQADWARQSVLGQVGQALEPAVRPLGWDWRIGVAALASFPAREVVVGTLGVVFQLGKVDSEEIRASKDAGQTRLGKALQEATWDGQPNRPLFTVPTALSVLVFFALCCQCASTLAVIRRETRSWRWPAFTFVYMTVLAYVAALAVYQIGKLFV